jgi:hypothetical protein
LKNGVAGEEGVHVLAVLGDVRRAAARPRDVLDEPRERRDAANEEGDNGAPVAGQLGVVAVDAMEVVHVRHGDVATADNVVAEKQVSGCFHGIVVTVNGGTHSVMRMEVMGPRKMV